VCIYLISLGAAKLPRIVNPAAAIRNHWLQCRQRHRTHLRRRLHCLGHASTCSARSSWATPHATFQSVRKRTGDVRTMLRPPNLFCGAIQRLSRNTDKRTNSQTTHKWRVYVRSPPDVCGYLFCLPSAFIRNNVFPRLPSSHAFTRSGAGQPPAHPKSTLFPAPVVRTERPDRGDEPAFRAAPFRLGRVPRAGATVPVGRQAQQACRHHSHAAGAPEAVQAHQRHVHNANPYHDLLSSLK